MKRTEYPELIENPAAQLALRSKIGVSLPEDYYNLPWAALHELRSKLRKGTKALLDKTEGENRDLEKDEKLAYDLALQGLDAIQEDFELRESAGTKDPVDLTTKAPRESGLLRGLDDTVHEERITQARGRSFRSLFHGREDVSLDRGGFKNFDDFLGSIINRVKDERLEKRTFLAKDGVAGGYSVPDIWAGSIYDMALESEIVRPRASVYPMNNGPVLHIPAWNNNDHETDGLYGGFSIEHLGENSTGTVQTGQLRSIQLIARKLGLYTEISREAAADGLTLMSQLQANLSKAVSFGLDTDFLTGDGVNKALGVLNSSALITVNRTTASQVGYTDLYQMFSRLSPTSHNSAVWVMNHSVLPQLMNLTVNSNLVFAPVQMFGVSGPVPMTLFGKPIIFSEKVPALGSKGDVMLCDFSQYAIGMRQELILDVSNAPGWTRDVVSLRAIVRVDGGPLWDKPYTGLNGGPTLSPFIALNTP